MTTSEQSNPAQKQEGRGGYRDINGWVTSDHVLLAAIGKNQCVLGAEGADVFIADVVEGFTKQIHSSTI